MNKQNLIILSLSAMFLITISFAAYSWQEPTTPMPNGYTEPLNSSISPQTKPGDLTFGTMYGFSTCNENNSDCPFYINPTGDSVVSGTISAANPTENSHVTTKEYVDSLLGTNQTASYEIVEGTACPAGTILTSKYYAEKICTETEWSCEQKKDAQGNPLEACQTNLRDYNWSTGSGWFPDPLSVSRSIIYSGSCVLRTSSSGLPWCDWVNTVTGIFNCQASITHVLCFRVAIPE